MSDDETLRKEYIIKAVCLYNFVRFIDWPADKSPAPPSSASNSIVIGVIGEQVVFRTIQDALKNRSIHVADDKGPVATSFVVRHMKLGPEVKETQILFIGGTEKVKVADLKAQIKDNPVLTVGETPGFAANGGIINFFLDDGKVHFEINPDAARRAHLTIRSELLKLATIVKDKK
jgi:hypothetical protein